MKKRYVVAIVLIALYGLVVVLATGMGFAQGLGVLTVGALAVSVGAYFGPQNHS